MKKPPINNLQVSSDELENALGRHPIPAIVARFKKLAVARLKEEIIARNNCKTLAEYRNRNKWHYPSTEDEAAVSFWPNEFLHAKGLSPIIDMLLNVYLATDAVAANMESGDVKKTAHSVFLFTAHAMQAGLFVDYLKEIAFEEQGIKLEKKEHAIKKMLPDAKRGRKVKKGAVAGGREKSEKNKEDRIYYRELEAEIRKNHHAVAGRKPQTNAEIIREIQRREKEDHVTNIAKPRTLHRILKKP